MSEGLNQVVLCGNLGVDPEMKAVGDTSVLKLRLATTESYLDKDKERQEKTEWHNVSIWGKRGEGLAKILEKGSRIVVTGSLKTSSYEKNGEKRYSTEIVASNVILAGGKRPDPSQPTAANGNAKAAGHTDSSFPWDNSAAAE